MTIFGIIWILIAIRLFFIKDIKPMILFTIIGMIMQCTNVIEFGKFACGPQLITSIIFIIKSIKYRVNDFKLNTFYKAYLIFLVYIVINMIVVNQNLNVNNFVSFMMIAIYFLAAIRMQVVCMTINKENFKKIIDVLTIIILIFGLYQLIIMIFNLERNNIIGTLFYNDLSKKSVIAYYTTEQVRFYSTFMEPSYLSGLLVGLFYYYLNLDTKTKKDYILIILLFISIILTFSTTAYLLIACVFVLIFIRNIDRIKKSKLLKNKKFYLMSIPITIIVLYLVLKSNVLDEVIFNKMSTGSGVTRNNWNKYAIEQFKTSPIFGVGFNSLRASSIMCDVLAELGLLGIIIYINPFIYLAKNYFKSKNNNVYNALTVMIIIMLGSQIIACPDLNLCSFWLVTYLYSLSIFDNKEGEKNNE